ncbi:MAG TPA: diguanylate cyclase [Burkholderiales bacterium]|nr:diguanylate cyclase [Burkholderiales bacterium]
MPPLRKRHIDSRKSPPPTLLAKVLASIANAVFITDNHGTIVWVNDAFCRLSGYTAREIIGQTPRMLKSGKQDDAYYKNLWCTISAGNVWRGEVVDRRKDGSVVTVDQVITPLLDNTGTITHFIAIQHDITSSKIANEREHHLAYHDALTDLPNRALFFDVLRQSFSRAKRSARLLALLYIDIDDFKPINDQYGHHAGDQLLKVIAERLNAAVRKRDIVARLGGDEFAILQADIPHIDVAVGLAQKLLHTVSQPFMLEGRQVRTSASIGIASYPADLVEAEDLLRNADKAMYLAKQQGRNTYRLYDDTMSGLSARQPCPLPRSRG